MERSVIPRLHHKIIILHTIKLDQATSRQMPWTAPKAHVGGKTNPTRAKAFIKTRAADTYETLEPGISTASATAAEIQLSLERRRASPRLAE